MQFGLVGLLTFGLILCGAFVFGRAQQGISFNMLQSAG